MKIFGIVQVKGGSGRSTVATNLAGELSKLGKTVLIDCDAPQSTATSWAALRQDQTGNLTVQTATTPRELMGITNGLKGQVDYAVFDAPPRLAEVTRTILVLADLVLIPIGASPAEIWATGDLKALLTEAEQHRKVKARLVWTRFRPHTNLAQTLSHEAGKALGLTALKSTLGYRVAYAEALGTGKTAAEVGDPVAKEEITGFVREVLRLA